MGDLETGTTGVTATRIVWGGKFKRAAKLIVCRPVWFGV
jgi:hypothetical protein